MKRLRLNANQQTESLSFSNFEHHLQILSRPIDEYISEHWYLFTIGIYLVLVPLDMLRQIHDYRSISVSRFSSLETCHMNDWIIVVTVAFLSFTAIAFNRWRKLIPKTLKGVLESGRILTKSNDKSLDQECEQFLNGYQQALQSNTRHLLTIFLMILSLVVTLIPFSQLVAPKALDPSRAFGSIFVNVLAPLLWSYTSAVGAWVMWTTGLYIRKLTTTFTLSIQPSHPDQCGGMRPIGDFCFGMAIPILIGSIFLGFFGLSGILEKDVPVTIAANVGILCFALPLASLALLAPLWSIHRHMVEKKRIYENEFANRTAKIEERIKDSLEKDNIEQAKRAIEELEIIQALYPKHLSYPEWPFDRSIIIRFLTPQVVPIISLVAGLSPPFAEALRSVLAILTKT